MTRRKKMPEPSRRAIRSMSYETRQSRYLQEKDELFRTHAGLPAAELSRLHQELVDKWMV